jgi:hypothetical protein
MQPQIAELTLSRLCRRFITLASTPMSKIWTGSGFWRRWWSIGALNGKQFCEGRRRREGKPERHVWWNRLTSLPMIKGPISLPSKAQAVKVWPPLSAEGCQTALVGFPHGHHVSQWCAPMSTAQGLQKTIPMMKLAYILRLRDKCASCAPQPITFRPNDLGP